LGAQVVKQAAIKTGEQAGDGTTTATVLTREIYNQALEAVSNRSNNAIDIKRGIDKAVKDIVAVLKDKSQDISNEDQLKQVATISANNDTEIGTLIATAFDKAGREGVITVEESKTHETTLEVVEGMQFDRGYKSPYFVTDNGSMTCQLDEPYILMYDGKISAVKELLPILEGVSQQNKSLLIVAEDIDGEALAAMIVNKMRGILKCAAVKAPDFGERRTMILEDMAALTGGTVISKQKGMKLDKVTLICLEMLVVLQSLKKKPQSLMVQVMKKQLVLALKKSKAKLTKQKATTLANSCNSVLENCRWSCSNQRWWSY
jgi:chaperonin GroEL